VPDEVDTDLAVFTEPLAAAFQILEQIRIDPADRVIVLGDGRLGNLCAQVLSGVSDHVLVIGKHDAKLDLLAQRGIETRRLDAYTGERSDVTAGDIVIDCTGSSSGVTTALALVRPRGTVVLKTTIAGTQTLSLAPVVVDEVSIVGSRCGPFPRALEALASGAIDVRPLIHQRFDLSDGVRALRRASERGVLKVLLDVAAA
jgi:threonine dehydrogenase-like Zn-dependent dehydrogenase